jgi:hypothetical protein
MLLRLPPVSPKIFEPIRCELGVAHGVLNVAMPKVRLHGARVTIRAAFALSLQGRNARNSGPLGGWTLGVPCLVLRTRRRGRGHRSERPQRRKN